MLKNSETTNRRPRKARKSRPRLKQSSQIYNTLKFVQIDNSHCNKFSYTKQNKTILSQPINHKHWNYFRYSIIEFFIVGNERFWPGSNLGFLTTFWDQFGHFNKAFQSVVFNSGQKMALRAFYVVCNMLELLLEFLWSRTPSTPSFGSYWKKKRFWKRIISAAVDFGLQEIY